MKKITVLITFLALILVVSSCNFEKHLSLQKIDETHEIKAMRGCCGCYAYYVNTTKEQQLKEQFIAELNCDMNSTTKYFFENNALGEPIIKDSLVAVTDDSFTIPISQEEVKIFQQLDSIYNQDDRYESSKEMKFSAFKGYRPAKEYESLIPVILK